MRRNRKQVSCREADQSLAALQDRDGNRTRITHPDGNSFSYGFDGLNRMCTLTEGATATACDASGHLLKVTYRPSGGRLDLIRPGGAVTNIDLDNALRLESFTQNFAGTANDLTNTFTYNPASQVTKLSQSNALYTYDQLGSRTGAYGVNGLNRITSIASGSAFAYDTAGNLTSDGTGMTYTYDMENRLVSTGSPSSTLVYDVLGRLARVTVGGTTTQFHYDGDALVGEYVNGALTRRYVHGDQVDEPLVQYTGASVGSSSRRYLHADHLGSVIAHSDSSGTVVQTNSYDAYGIPRSTNDGRFGYTGQTWLKELGLNYYKARMYAPKLGRFLQTDPIFYKDDMNLYAYVSNDPINAKDPTGTKCEGDEKTGKCTADMFNGVDIAKARKEGMISASMEKKISRYENSLSRGYRQALKFGENKVSVRGWASAPPRQVSGNQIAGKLQETRGGGYQLHGEAGAYSGAFLPQSNGTQIYDSSAWSVTLKTLNLPAGALYDRYQAGNGLHEVIHKFPGLGSGDPFHQESFRKAVDEILDYK